MHPPAKDSEFKEERPGGLHGAACCASSFIDGKTSPTVQTDGPPDPNPPYPTSPSEESWPRRSGYPWETEKARLEEWHQIPLDPTGKSVLSRHELVKVASLLRCMEVFHPSMTISQLLRELLRYARHRSSATSFVRYLVEHPLFSDERIAKLDGPTPQSDVESLMLHAMCGSFQSLMSLGDFPDGFFDSLHNADVEARRK